MNKKDIRWKQRFENYKKALALLEDGMKVKDPSLLERAGLIQVFEMSFELAWKTLKDYLEDKGHLLTAPRDVLKQAFQDGIIEEGETWLKALSDRNLTTHLYNEAKASELLSAIRKDHLPLLIALKKHLENEF